MAGLVPAIHVGTCFAGSSLLSRGRREMCLSSETTAPRNDVDTRDKPGQDADGDDQTP
jgi:hypothetical protein